MHVLTRLDPQSEFLVPLWMVGLGDHFSLHFLARKVEPHVGVHQLLLLLVASEDLADALEHGGIHLGNIFCSEHFQPERRRLQLNSGRSQQVPAREQKGKLND